MQVRGVRSSWETLATNSVLTRSRRRSSLTSWRTRSVPRPSGGKSTATAWAARTRWRGGPSSSSRWAGEPGAAAWLASTKSRSSFWRTASTSCRPPRHGPGGEGQGRREGGHVKGEADDAAAPARLEGYGDVEHLHPQRPAPAQVAPDGAGQGRADLGPSGVVLHDPDPRLVALGIGKHGAVGRDHRDAGLQTLPVGPGQGLERRGRRPDADGRNEDVPEEPGLSREPC